MGRDDLSVELLSLFNPTGQHEKALAFVAITEISALGRRGSSGAHKARENTPGSRAAGIVCGRCNRSSSSAPVLIRISCSQWEVSVDVVVTFPNFTQSLRVLTFSLFRQASIQMDRHTETRKET